MFFSLQNFFEKNIKMSKINLTKAVSSHRKYNLNLK